MTTNRWIKVKNVLINLDEVVAINTWCYTLSHNKARGIRFHTKVGTTVDTTEYEDEATIFADLKMLKDKLGIL